MFRKPEPVDIDAILFRGRAADHLLNDETLNSALDEIERLTLKEWRESHSRDLDGREAAYSRLLGLDAFRGQLKRWLEDATFEAAKLEKQRRNKRD